MPKDSSTFDFDAFRRESEALREGDAEPVSQVPPKTMKVLGISYPLPNTLSAVDVLLSLRDGHTQVSRVKMLDNIFGPETVMGWVEQGMGIPDLMTLAIIAEGIIRGVEPSAYMEAVKKKRDGTEPGAMEVEMASGSGNGTSSKGGGMSKAVSAKRTVFDSSPS